MSVSEKDNGTGTIHASNMRWDNEFGGWGVSAGLRLCLPLSICVHSVPSMET